MILKSISNQLFTEIHLKGKKSIPFFGKKGINDKERKEIFYLLYSFSKRNIPLLRTLLILENEFPKEQRLKMVKDDILQGIALSYSLKNRGIGDEFVFATIHIGEETGNITKALENTYEYYKNREIVKEEFLKISIYPMIVLCNIVLLFLFTFNNIFPSLLEIYNDSNIALPSSLKYFDMIYSIQKNHRALIWIVFMWTVYGIIKFCETDTWYDYYGKIQFRIPILCNVKRLFFQKDFLWRVSCLLDGGIAIKESLIIIQETEHNRYLKTVFSEMIFLIERGKSVADTLSQYPELFSIKDISYIRQGEESGGLRENVNALCFLYKRESEKIISKISNYGQPIMILCLGLLVGIVAFSIIPLMNVTEVYM